MGGKVSTAIGTEVWDKEAVRSNQDKGWFVVLPLGLSQISFSLSCFEILLEVRIRGIIEQALVGNSCREIDGCGIESSTAWV